MNYNVIVSLFLVNFRRMNSWSGQIIYNVIVILGESDNNRLKSLISLIKAANVIMRIVFHYVT